jgi:hypothetical protein
MEGLLRFYYREKYWLGVSIRTEDSFSAMVGMSLGESLIMGYSYDILTSNLKNYSTGSHELMVGLKFIDRNKRTSVKIE